jgi:hypothetical protein
MGAFMLFMLYVLPKESHQFFGTALVGMGVLIILLHRILGKGLFGASRVLPPSGVRFYNFFGPKGLQRVYLGSGTIFVVEGVIMLIWR